MIAPNPPKIYIPLIFSIIAAILGIVVLATPGLYESKYDYKTVEKKQIGPFRACYSNPPIIDECVSIDTSCKATFHFPGKSETFNVFNKSASCPEFNWMRGLFMIAFLTGIASILLAIISRYTIRLQLTSAIITSIISAIAGLIAMSLAIAIFVAETAYIYNIDSTFTNVYFTYGSTMIIIFTVLHFCAAIAYHRAKRLAFLNHAMTQPLVATTTVYTPPVYAVPVAQPQYQPQYTQQTYAYPQQPQQPQQL